jgi:predicted DCC family thiol-disulfide oxidoreductase YuxK
VIYDGDCPFCSNFVRLYRLRENVGSVELIDARQDQALVETLRKEGMEINDGMVVIWKSQKYHGADAMHLLSMLSAEKGAFASVNRLLFRNRRLAECVYPVLVTGRRMTLVLMGRKLISNTSHG